MRSRWLKWIVLIGGALSLAGAFLVWYGTQHPGAYQKHRQKNLRPGEQYGVQYRKPGEIVVEDLGNGKKRVTDKRQGYSVEVPGEWKLQEPKATNDIAYFYDDKDGCDFSIGAVNETSLDAIVRREEENHQYLTLRAYKVMDEQIMGFSAKRVVQDSEEFGYSQSLSILTAKGVYGADVTIKTDGRDLCIKFFDQLVSSVNFQI